MAETPIERRPGTDQSPSRRAESGTARSPLGSAGPDIRTDGTRAADGGGGSGLGVGARHASLDGELEAELAAIDRRGLRRSTADMSIGVDFTSNDYLGLAREPSLARAAVEATERYGSGPGAARLLAGALPDYDRAERAVAEWLEAPAALLFPSGYQANLGLVSALATRGDAIISDALNHASLIDAARLSRAAIRVHPHLDLEAVERELLATREARRRLVLTEAVFSMDGDRAPLAELHELCERYDAWLVVDEAHATGLLGPRGAGAWAELSAAGLDGPRLAARVVTGGKALGATGALVVGSAPLREILVHRARSFIFTTAPAPSTAAALIAGVERAADDVERREQCHRVATALAEGLGLERPAAAIVPFVVGEPEAAMACASRARAAGFAVRAVRPPTVPEGSSRLRLVAHAHNTVAEVEGLLSCLRSDSVQRAAGSPGAPPSPPPPPTTLLSRGDVNLPGTAISGGASSRTAATDPGGPGGTGTTTGSAPLAPPQIATPQAPDALAPSVDRPLAPAIVVAGTDTDVGKTVVSAMALHALSRQGPAGYWKPIQTGVDAEDLHRGAGARTEDDTWEVQRLASAPSSILAEPLRRYPLPASPHEAAAAVGDDVPVEELTPHLLELRRRAPERAWVVELAGGLLVPYRVDVWQADWLQEIGLPILLVGRSGLGTLNHTLLSVEVARARGLDVLALVLVGEPHPSNRSTLIELTGIADVFELEPLAAVNRDAVVEWVDRARSHRGLPLPDVLRPVPATSAGRHRAGSADPSN